MSSTGRSPIGINGLGSTVVYGRSRVPSPPARITARFIAARPRDRRPEQALDLLGDERGGVRPLGVRAGGSALTLDPLGIVEVALEQRPQRSGGVLRRGDRAELDR